MDTPVHQTPLAALRATPQTGPRGPKPKARPVHFSSAPLCTIDVNALPPSRFLAPHARRLPYRDASGRVNVHLCARSLTELQPDDDAETRDKLSAWDRHARRAIGARAAEEALTVDELCALEAGRAAEAAVKAVETTAAADDLPLSLRKPRRAVARSTPARAAPAETVVVLEPSGERGDAESGAGRVASSTLAMQRRLFRAPRADDEPTADSFYLRSLLDRRRGRRSPSDSDGSDDDDDVWEVQEVLKEDAGTGRFLIRWAGFSPEHDSWEPEANVSAALVEAFRARAALATTHARSDDLDGRVKMMWCAACAEHRPADCFSANQRRCTPASRACLNHHYGIGSPAGSLGRKRPSSDRASASPLGSPPLLKRPRPTSSRHADLEVAKSRLYGWAL